MPDRALASPVAVVLLLVVVVAAAGALGAAVLGMAETPSAPESVAVAADVSASGRVTLVHRGGPTLDARDLAVEVTVDDEPLARQPPVPFFSADGFASGPTGPFNTAADPQWSVGERAGFRVAETNDPEILAGASVTVRLRYRDQPLWRATLTVPDGSAGTDSRSLAGLDRPPP